MSKLGVLLTICLLLFPLTALPLDGDQPADQRAERTQAEKHSLPDPRMGCCPFPCKTSCTTLCCG
uniref:Conotoxin Mr3.5 n=1 Tax=Conus marmoreus TaxID=42752 RepID=CM35_CONMR|nr:RecName: Full=Conotoxin Mr3.5; Flags: Precursor [Conus marmoreus]